jgi:hypothetical protein
MAGKSDKNKPRNGCDSKIVRFRVIAESVFRWLERSYPSLHGFGRNVAAEVRAVEMDFLHGGVSGSLS